VARILIAEDDPLIGSLLEKGLNNEGFCTALVDDGQEAEHLGLTDHFDLMILDMGLPERDGFQVLQELRSHGQRLPILVVTGRREIDAMTCLDAGADDYVGKPFQFAELLSHVRTLLGMEDGAPEEQHQGH
jgi:DNA-binding response OmpR family regulator